MAKFLLLIAVLAVIYFVVRASNRRARPPVRTDRLEGEMTQCAYCGVHFPGDEVVSGDGRDYCCEEHRRLGVRS